MRSIAIPVVLGLVCLLVYNANLRPIGAGDSLSARYLPLVLLHGGSLELSSNAPLFAHGHPMALPRYRSADPDGKAIYFEPAAYWVVRTREHELADFYPVVTPLLVAPLYVPAVLWLNAAGWEQPHVDRVAEVTEKLSASILAAIASVLVYLLLRREGNPWALALALVFAFGTNTWMISSQALWQHGTGELLIALALLLARAPASAKTLAFLGAACVLMAANRPPDALIAAAIGCFVVFRRWRDAGWLIAGGSVPLAALLYYNVVFIGHPAGGYGVVNPPGNFLQRDWSGLAGLLVSPARGLLVFSPFLLFVPVGLRERLRAPGTTSLAAALFVAVIAQLVLYSQGDWRAGTSWGPRWLTDLLPILIWMLAPAPLVLSRVARSLLVALMLMSVGVQTVGAFWYTRTSDERIYALDPASMRGAWNPQNIPFITELQHAPVFGELLCGGTATVDRIGQTILPSGGTLPELAPGAVLEGWALACARSPAQLVVLVDGIVVGSTTQFVPRSDVDSAMHTHAPSGWRISANLWGIAPGERVIQIGVRVEPRSDFRIVREQRVVVTSEQPLAQSATVPPTSVSELASFAERASSLLRGHQTDDGAWLTAHTTSMQFVSPRPEMNTFVTSLLADLIAPVAPQRGLDAALERARAHLAAQIESDGLVRYHGLPNGATIGKL
ncbi:MAG TPA: hypothetical protein VF132_13940, partial [Rudaea sp.]